MRVSIGILAWNEERTIAATLRGVFAQTLLKSELPGVESVELVVVPNGCNDRTATVAAEAMDSGLAAAGGSGRVAARVCEVAQAGKSNAWNEYVHRLSDPRADYLMLLDADIEFGTADVLWRLVSALEADRAAVVAAPQPVKRFPEGSRRTLVDRMSAATSKTNAATVHGLAGALYCGRAAVLRELWLPPGLLVEDAFLRALLVTDRFTRPEEPGRLIRVPRAEVGFEAVRTVAGIFRHERRILVGVAVNAILFRELWERGGRGEHVGEFIRKRNEEDPQWVRHLVRERIAGRWWVLPGGLVGHRLRRALQLNARAWITSLPVAVMGTLFDLFVSLSANAQLKRLELRW